MRALIDGDILVYQCAFAAQYKAYLVTHSDLKDPVAYRYKKLVPAGMEFTRINIIESEEKAYDAVDSAIAGILRATHATDFQVFVTKKACFRHSLTPTYKANRQSEKPVYYAMIRRYLEERYKALFVDGIEADDALGIVHTNLNEIGVKSVVCTIDKDLLNVPGYHYNPTKGDFKHITPAIAKRNYMFQMLIGDTADNIKGIPGLGKEKTAKLLSGPDTEWGGIIREEYQKFFGDDGDRMMNLNRKLLWILHREHPNYPFTTNKPLMSAEPLSTASKLLLSPTQENSASAFTHKKKGA